MTRLTSFLFCLSVVSACGAEDTDPETGADASATAASCDGGDRFIVTGAFTLETPSVGMATLGGNIIGATGFSTDGDLYAFSIRDILDDNLHDVGERDVAEVPLKFITHEPGAECDEAPQGTCTGFYALAGTYTVTESGPRYKATFELNDLFERHDNTNELGESIAGTVSGCIDSPMP